jgi:hypothetical protein
MRLLHLTENELPEGAQEHALAIARECSQFIREADGHLMYRGMSDLETDEVHYVKSRVRKASDTDPEITKLLNDVMSPIAGFKPRSEAAFATGDSGFADTYGNTFAMFPKDDYKFIWSPYIADAFAFFHLGMRDAAADLVAQTMETMPEGWEEDDDNRAEFVEQFLEMHKDVLFKTGANSTIVEAIESQNEIMIHTSGYYLVPYDTELGQAVLKLIHQESK